MEKENYTFHKAVKVKFQDGVSLDVTFSDGYVKRYDLAGLYDKYPQLKKLEDRDLFESGKLYRYGIIWNDELDFDTESIYQEGTVIRKIRPIENIDVGEEITCARANRSISQARLGELVGIDQSDISKIERGAANPSVKTLRKIANALNCNLVIKLEPKDPNE